MARVLPLEYHCAWREEADELRGSQLHRWIDEQVACRTPKSPLGQAISYRLKNLAGLYALVATCEANGINPEQYLADLLLRVQTHHNSRLEGRSASRLAKTDKHSPRLLSSLFSTLSIRRIPLKPYFC